MFNITSTMILGYVYLFFKDNGKGELLEEQLDDLKDENHLFNFENDGSIITTSNKNTTSYDALSKYNDT